MEWKVPKIWNGECFILGGGPSLNKINLNKLKKKRTIGTNNVYEIAPFVDVLYFMDCMWYNWHKNTLSSFKGLKVTTCHECQNIRGIKFLRTGKINELDSRPAYLSRGNNTGYGAMSLAIKLGATRIILLGFDMHYPNGEANFHNNHKREVEETRYSGEFVKKFNEIAETLKSKNIEVINATPNSTLKVFPIMEPDDVF